MWQSVYEAEKATGECTEPCLRAVQCICAYDTMQARMERYVALTEWRTCVRATGSNVAQYYHKRYVDGASL